MVEIEAITIKEATEKSVALGKADSRSPEVDKGSQYFVESLFVIELIASAVMCQHFFHFLLDGVV